MAEPDKNRLNPEQMEALRTANWDGPVVVMSLMKFSERAHYDNGDRGISGREAYNIYGQLAAPHIAAAGGHIISRGNATHLLIGGEAEDWDSMFLIEYPSRQAFYDMITSPDYQEAAENRTAALDRGALIATRPTI